MESTGVLKALDTAKTQWYHFTAIVVAGMGFFTDAYDLFCITCVTKLLGRLYYPEIKDHRLPPRINYAVTSVALVGTFAGHLLFGTMGDKLGRKKVYGVTLVMMVVCSIASGFSFGGGVLSGNDGTVSPQRSKSHRNHVIGTLLFFRFWLGVGIGGDYPLSATIMSEYANQKTRGSFIAAVFAMQGMGILAAGIVSMIVASAFNKRFPSPPRSTRVEGDYVWRIILMFGAAPALLTLYWRMKMPETARFTALVQGNSTQAVADMAKVLKIDETELTIEERVTKTVRQTPKYSLLSSEFLRRHGRHLLGTATTWCLLDIAFYSGNLTQKDVYSSVGFIPLASTMNGLEEVFQISKAQFLIALCGAIPGYWFTVFFIDRVGRYAIQLMGFLLMSIYMLLLGVLFYALRGHKCSTSDTGYCDGNPKLFAFMYAMTFFFANFGPNSTTFVLPAELFPARLRSTCHGISAAAGKLGAIFSAFVVQSYTQKTQPHRVKKSLLFLAFVNLLGFFCTFLVTETNQRSLEDISGENEDEKPPQRPPNMSEEV